MLTQLKHIGLSDNEAKVYLAMLELGPSSVLEIAAKAAINRPTAYVQIESLKKKGLVSMQTKGKKQLYIAEDPEQLEYLLGHEKKELEQKQEELKSVLPELKAMFDLAEEKPVVRYFEGKEGLLKMQEDFLKAKRKEILAISPVDEVFSVFPDHKNTYTPRRVKKGIKSRLIYTSTENSVYPRKDEKMLRETRYISPKKMPFSADITIFDDNVAIAALKGNISGAIISHKEIANSFRGIFEILWMAAEKI